jgi:ATP-dependent Clp protease adaptor protein ClpS
MGETASPSQPNLGGSIAADVMAITEQPIGRRWLRHARLTGCARFSYGLCQAWQCSMLNACERIGTAMAKSIVKPRTAVRPKTKRPPLYKVILLNDDYTPREFVVLVLKAVFRMNEDEAYRVMMTAHRRGACVIAVYAKDVAETKAKEATELGKSKGYPLFFTTEPEE